MSLSMLTCAPAWETAKAQHNPPADRRAGKRPARLFFYLLILLALLSFSGCMTLKDPEASQEFRADIAGRGGAGQHNFPGHPLQTPASERRPALAQCCHRPARPFRGRPARAFRPRRSGAALSQRPSQRSRNPAQLSSHAHLSSAKRPRKPKLSAEAVHPIRCVPGLRAQPG